MEERLHQERGDNRPRPPPIPSFESLCQQNYPGQWRILTAMMWLLFFITVATTLSYQSWQARKAQAILLNHSEVMARVTKVVPGVNGGDYMTYAVELELPVDSSTRRLTLKIPEATYDFHYAGDRFIPIIYTGPDEYGLKSRYERQAALYVNWPNLLIGFLIVFLALYYVRHYALKSLCSPTGE